MPASSHRKARGSRVGLCGTTKPVLAPPPPPRLLCPAAPLRCSPAIIPLLTRSRIVRGLLLLAADTQASFRPPPSLRSNQTRALICTACLLQSAPSPALVACSGFRVNEQNAGEPPAEAASDVRHLHAGTAGQAEGRGVLGPERRGAHAAAASLLRHLLSGCPSPHAPTLHSRTTRPRTRATRSRPCRRTLRRVCRSEGSRRCCSPFLFAGTRNNTHTRHAHSDARAPS